MQIYLQLCQQTIHLVLGGVPGGDEADATVIFIYIAPMLKGHRLSQRFDDAMGQNGEKLVAGALNQLGDLQRLKTGREGGYYGNDDG